MHPERLDAVDHEIEKLVARGGIELGT